MSIKVFAHFYTFWCHSEESSVKLNSVTSGEILLSEALFQKPNETHIFSVFN